MLSLVVLITRLSIRFQSKSAFCIVVETKNCDLRGSLKHLLFLTFVHLCSHFKDIEYIPFFSLQYHPKISILVLPLYTHIPFNTTIQSLITTMQKSGTSLYVYKPLLPGPTWPPVLWLAFALRRSENVLDSDVIKCSWA